MAEKLTCSCRSSDSVDVDLGKAGGVVVDDDLDSRNIQTPESRREAGRMSKQGDLSLSTAVAQSETLGRTDR